MELDRLYKSSTFLSKYEYLNNSYDVSKVDAQLILNHYKSNIKKYSNSSTTNFLNINTLKNELIYLIFISIHQNLISNTFYFLSMGRFRNDNGVKRDWSWPKVYEFSQNFTNFDFFIFFRIILEFIPYWIYSFFVIGLSRRLVYHPPNVVVGGDIWCFFGRSSNLSIKSD